MFRFLPLIKLTAAGCSLSLAGCSEDRPYTFQPAPGEPTFEVRIAPSENLTSIETDALTQSGKTARVRCETCHAQIDVGQPARSPNDLTEFHQGLQFNHGNLACSSCHEPGEPLLLRLATGETFSMVETMRLCSQCHGTQRRSYENGSHGGMNGYWDLSRGPRLRNQCIHCHDAHSPQIAPVSPAPPPRDRGQLPPNPAHKGAH